MPYADPVRKREYSRLYYQRTRETRLAAAAAYRVEHREEVNAWHRRRYAEQAEKRKRQITENERVSEAVRVRRRQRGRLRLRAEPDAGYAAILNSDVCCYCGAAAGHVDHIVAVARGGDGGWPNLTSVCDDCNNRKGANSVLRFMLNRVVDAEFAAAA